VRKLKIGRHAVPLWLIVVILVSLFGFVVGFYVWETLHVPLEVKEPLEILSYPSKLSVYVSDRLMFNVTVMNHSSKNYSVTLDFSLNNATYQSNYVSFSNEIYVVKPGQQNLVAWLEVAPGAPSIDETLTIRFSRDPSS